MYKKRRCIPSNSFTLIELLVVMAIMAIMAALTVPAIMGMMRSSSLTTGSNRLVDQLNICRQFAMAKNCQVEFRFYQLPDVNAASTATPSVYRAFQSFSLDYGGAQTNAITKVIYLPSQIYMSTFISGTVTNSTLLTTNSPPYYVPGTTAGTSLGAYPSSSYNYFDFHFKPDGSTDLTPTFASPWYVSFANQNDATNATTGLPANFITVQIDASTGRARYFRPN